MSKPLLPEKTFLKPPRPSGTISRKSKPRHASVAWNPVQMPFSPHLSLPPLGSFCIQLPQDSLAAAAAWWVALVESTNLGTLAWLSALTQLTEKPTPLHCRFYMKNKHHKISHPNLHLDQNPALFLAEDRAEPLGTDLPRTLRSSEYTDAEPPVTGKPQSPWPSQHCPHRGLVGVSRSLWPWIRRSWFLIQASHQPVVGLWTSHWSSPGLSSHISGVPTLPRLQSYPKNSDVEITTNFRSFYTSHLVGYWGGSRER